MSSLLINDLENDELDLVKLVCTDANDFNQYLIFKASNDSLFALNVSKIEEVMVFDKNLQIAKNSDSSGVIHGTADIRESMTTVVYFDDWFGNSHLDDSEYELIILVNYGGQKVGIIVKGVLNITTIEADTMSENSHNDNKTTFVSKIHIEGREQICTVYDGDQMLLDIFGSVKYKTGVQVNQNDILALKNRVVYFADDSKLVRSLVEDLFNRLKLTYKVFSDGSFLIEYLEKNPEEKVDMIITDLEMPKMGGREVVSKIRENSLYNDVPVLVHTNMANDIMDEELLNIGTNVVIGKMDMQELSRVILRELTL